ncbi:MAG TPA: MCE family protein [Actinomycetota bacterium]|nr:MCE family protein [Actinomycetota bacterium]
MSRRSSILVGLAAILMLFVSGAYIINGLGGRTGGPFQVTVTFDRVGQLLRVSGDVKMRGVLVGQIHRIEKHLNGAAEVVLTLQPRHRIPADASASIRGKTLFGEKYVELIDPEQPTGALLKPGDVIPQSRTIPPLELEQVLDSLQPLLDAIEPGELGGAIGAVAEGLAGQEEEAGRAIDNTLVVLESLGASRDDLDRLLAGIDEGSDAFARATPDFVAALADLEVLARAIVENADDLRAVLGDAPEWLDVAAQIVEERYDDLVDLSVKGADILDLVASHASELPMAVEALKDFTQAWVTNLSTPCENVAGVTVGEAHPELAGSTCWQVWALTSEKNRVPGGYGPAEKPTPGSAVAAAAYVAQLRQLLGLPFGTPPSDLAVLMHGAIRDAAGLIPEAML